MKVTLLFQLGLLSFYFLYIEVTLSISSVKRDLPVGEKSKAVGSNHQIMSKEPYSSDSTRHLPHGFQREADVNPFGELTTVLILFELQLRKRNKSKTSILKSSS